MPLPTTMPVTSPRRRALAELELRIQQAEQIRGRCHLDVQHQAAAMGSSARMVAALRMADERLALLRQSREVLLAEAATGRRGA